MSDRVDVAKLLARLNITAELDGDEYLGLCPSHQDEKPSWSINRNTSKHHCFSCGFGGTATSLVIHALDMGRLGWQPRDAWAWLKEQGLLVGDGEQGFGVELFLQPTMAPRAFDMPGGVVVSPLEDWPATARKYAERRELAGWQVKRWGVGFAVHGRLRGRIVFPVHDAALSLRTYTARSFVGAEPRYMTPNEAEGPDHAALFGERFWPPPGSRKGRRVVVVEGALKGLAVERANGELVGGLLGATASGNASIIAKLATFGEVVILTDADRAGQVAAEKLYVGLARHTRARVTRMPGFPVDEAEPHEIRAVLG